MGVVGKPVPIYGEVPVAFVVRNSDIGVTEKELVDYVATEVFINKMFKKNVIKIIIKYNHLSKSIS